MTLEAHDRTTTTDISVRVTGSIVGALERPILIVLARAMPQWVSSNMLTLLGLGGAALAAIAYVMTAYDAAFLWLASIGLMLNWFGDSLDGTLARVRRAERPRYGFLLDHTTDIASQLLIGLGAGASPFINFDIACIGLLTFLAFMVFSALKAVISGELQIAYSGIGPTEVRCALIGMNAALCWYRPHTVLSLWEPLSAIDLFILAVSAGALIMLTISAVATFREIAREEGVA